MDMKPRGYLKRFCFGLDNSTEIENYISFVLENIKGKNLMKDLGIENYQVFCDTSFCFFILDVQQTIDIKDLKTKLEDEKRTTWELLGLDRSVMLDRVFKKDAQENQFTKELDNGKRMVMTLELRNNKALIEEYKEIHAAVWPQIINNMDIMGIKDMEIYLLGSQAFLIMDTNQDFDLDKEGERWASFPREKEWQEYVAKFQKVDPKSKAVEKWKLMTLLGQI